MNRPLIVCICGSTRFKDAWLKAMADETKAGRIYLAVGVFGHSDGVTHTPEEKARLDVLHLEKVRLADEVLILDVDGYIGESTRRELEYAKMLGKVIRFLSEESLDA